MKILASRRFPGPAWDELQDVEYYEQLDGERADIDALVVVGDAVDDRVLDLFPRLSLVANYGVGYDAIDVQACRARGVAVTNTPGVLDAATADLTLALILASRRRLVEGDAFVRAGRWGSDWVATELLGQEVSGSRLGIVGLGRIGSAVARRAYGFDMGLLYAKRERLRAEEERELGLEFRHLDDLLGEADIVTIHVPLSQETEKLIDERRISLLLTGRMLRQHGERRDRRRDGARGGPGRRPHPGRARRLRRRTGCPGRVARAPERRLSPRTSVALRMRHERAMTRVLVDNLLAAERGERLPNLVT